MKKNRIIRTLVCTLVITSVLSLIKVLTTVSTNQSNPIEQSHYQDKLQEVHSSVILENLDQEDTTLHKNIIYTLIDIDDDGQDELLYYIETSGTGLLEIYTINNNTLLNIDCDLTVGVAHTGGYRSGISLPQCVDGIIHSQFSSTKPDIFYDYYHIENNTLQLFESVVLQLDHDQTYEAINNDAIIEWIYFSK